MPVGGAIEIGGNRAAHRTRVAPAGGERCRGIGQHQRRAVRRAEDHPAIAARRDRQTATASALANSPSLAAELQVAPARRRRQLWNTDAFEDLVRREPGFEDPGRELGAVDRPPAVWTGRTVASASSAAKHRRPFGGRVGERQAAADRAAVADRAIGEARGDPRQQSAARGRARRCPRSSHGSRRRRRSPRRRRPRPPPAPAGGRCRSAAPGRRSAGSSSPRATVRRR